MAKYDGLIIPRSYSDYLNKTDGATLSQMLDSIGGTFDAVPTANSVKPARSGGIFSANAVITSDNATFTGVAISARSVVRVMFTAALTGSDAETGLTLTYNGSAYAVKVGKNGALVALTAHLVEESYVYLQAYTTLELAFDGSQFVVMGNPVVISKNDFNIMADGSITYKSTVIDSLRPKEIFEEKTNNFEIPVGNVELILLDWRGYAGYYWIGLCFSYQSGVNIYAVSTNTGSSPISANGHSVSVSYEGQIPMVTRYKMNLASFY